MFSSNSFNFLDNAEQLNNISLNETLDLSPLLKGTTSSSVDNAKNDKDTSKLLSLLLSNPLEFEKVYLFTLNSFTFHEYYEYSIEEFNKISNYSNFLNMPKSDKSKMGILKTKPADLETHLIKGPYKEITVLLLSATDQLWNLIWTVESAITTTSSNSEYMDPEELEEYRHIYYTTAHPRPFFEGDAMSPVSNIDDPDLNQVNDLNPEELRRKLFGQSTNVFNTGLHEEEYCGDPVLQGTFAREILPMPSRNPSKRPSLQPSSNLSPQPLRNHKVNTNFIKNVHRIPVNVICREFQINLTIGHTPYQLNDYAESRKKYYDQIINNNPHLAENRGFRSFVGRKRIQRSTLVKNCWVCQKLIRKRSSVQKNSLRHHYFLDGSLYDGQVSTFPTFISNYENTEFKKNSQFHKMSQNDYFKEFLDLWNDHCRRNFRSMPDTKKHIRSTNQRLARPILATSNQTYSSSILLGKESSAVTDVESIANSREFSQSSLESPMTILWGSMSQSDVSPVLSSTMTHVSEWTTREISRHAFFTIRNGGLYTVDSIHEIYVGDIVIIRPGGVVPYDIRVIAVLTDSCAFEENVNETNHELLSKTCMQFAMLCSGPSRTHSISMHQSICPKGLRKISHTNPNFETSVLNAPNMIYRGEVSLCGFVFGLVVRDALDESLMSIYIQQQKFKNSQSSRVSQLNRLISEKYGISRQTSMDYGSQQSMPSPHSFELNEKFALFRKNNDFSKDDVAMSEFTRSVVNHCCYDINASLIYSARFAPALLMDPDVYLNDMSSITNSNLSNLTSNDSTEPGPLRCLSRRGVNKSRAYVNSDMDLFTSLLNWSVPLEFIRCFFSLFCYISTSYKVLFKSFWVFYHLYSTEYCFIHVEGREVVDIIYEFEDLLSSDRSKKSASTEHTNSKRISARIHPIHEGNENTTKYRRKINPKTTFFIFTNEDLSEKCKFETSTTFDMHREMLKIDEIDIEKYGTIDDFEHFERYILSMTRKDNTIRSSSLLFDNVEEGILKIYMKIIYVFMTKTIAICPSQIIVLQNCADLSAFLIMTFYTYRDSSVAYIDGETVLSTKIANSNSLLRTSSKNSLQSAFISDKIISPIISRSLDKGISSKGILLNLTRSFWACSKRLFFLDIVRVKENWSNCVLRDISGKHLPDQATSPDKKIMPRSRTSSRLFAPGQQPQMHLLGEGQGFLNPTTSTPIKVIKKSLNSPPNTINHTPMRQESISTNNKEQNGFATIISKICGQFGSKRSLSSSMSEFIGSQQIMTSNGSQAIGNNFHFESIANRILLITVDAGFSNAFNSFFSDVVFSADTSVSKVMFNIMKIRLELCELMGTPIKEYRHISRKNLFKKPNTNRFTPNSSKHNRFGGSEAKFVDIFEY